MFDFKADTVNIYKTSPYNEGDLTESMEAYINVYTNGVYNLVGIQQIYVRLKNGQGYFVWYDNQRHELYSLRSAAFTVIQECVETIKKAKSYDDRKFLSGDANKILNSLIEK